MDKVSAGAFQTRSWRSCKSSGGILRLLRNTDGAWTISARTGERRFAALIFTDLDADYSISRTQHRYGDELTRLSLAEEAIKKALTVGSGPGRRGVPEGVMKDLKVIATDTIGETS